MPNNIVLASSSIYRKALLERFKLPFTCHSPDIDESVRDGESATDYVMRLSIEKAQAVQNAHPNATIIASDQCAVLDGVILGKPHHHSNAVEQLRRSSGKPVLFLTGLAVLNSDNLQLNSSLSTTTVSFRTLQDEEIERYLLSEQPYQCAGSFKSEALGCTLFNSIEGDDPTALIGLPLIKLAELLRKHDYLLP